MTIKRHSAASAVLTAGALVLAGCGTDQNVPPGGGNPALQSLQVECGTKSVSGEGSSAQKNAVDVFARDYGLKCEENVNYTKSGSGKGVAAFTAGQVDFGGSDSPLSEEKGEVAEAAQRCGGNPAWNLPMVFGPVAIAYNLEGVTDLTLNADVIAKIYQGQITKWDDPAIQALNRARSCRPPTSSRSSAPTSPAPRRTSRSTWPPPPAAPGPARARPSRAGRASARAGRAATRCRSR
ncbi:hypothetical protein GCM10023108_00030 [Saccharopolyspora hordei]